MAACLNQSKLDPETEANLDWFAQSRGSRPAIVSRAQLLAAGVSRSSIDRAVCAGRLHRVHRGVYAAVAPELLTEEGHLVAALLAAGDGALLSHGTAAWRWRIIAAPPSMIELAVPRRRMRDLAG